MGAAKNDANRADSAPETRSIDDLADVLLALHKAERLRLAKPLLGVPQRYFEPFDVCGPAAGSNTCPCSSRANVYAPGNCSPPKSAFTKQSSH
jgi:hypothetical protein